MRSEHSKATFIDRWYKAYTRNCGHRIHIADKRQANKAQRTINKALCKA